MSSTENLKCKKVPSILRYFEPNQHKQATWNYAHTIYCLCFILLILLQNYLKIKLSANEKLNEPGVIDIVNKNSANMEPFSELIEEAFVHIRNDMRLNINDFEQQDIRFT